MQTAGHSLLGIINDILDFSKIEAGKLEFETVPFNLDDVLGNLLATVGAGIEKRELELLFKIDPATPRLLVGDPLRLGQVLTNLTSNAVKFTEQGEVVVGVKPEQLADQHTVLRFYVKDTGIGINPLQMRHLFESFSQVDETITRKFGGTGLGLVICKRLVEQMHGDIRLDSELGRGSTFSFSARFGIATEPQQVAAAAERNPTDWRAPTGARVLLVEDNEINQEIACELLRGQGLEVQVADNGLQALAVVQSEHFDLVLMDLQMPEMDGYQATKAIRAMPELQSLPIIAMTAHALDSDRDNCLALGMNGHISKPIDPQKLYATLAHWLAPSVQRRTDGARVAPVQETPHSGDALPDSLAGFDLADGLEKVAGNRALYLRLLDKFRRNNQDTAAQLRKALQAGDTDAARRIAHTIKGVAGNLGAYALADSAAALEQDIRQKSALADPALFEQCLADTLAGLAALHFSPAPAPVEDGRRVDVDAAVKLLEALSHALELDYAKACRHYDSLRVLLEGSRHGAELSRLGEAMAEFDTETATASIVRLAAELAGDEHIGRNPATVPPGLAMREL